MKDIILTKLLITIIIIWVIFAIIFGLTDLEISKAVVDKESLWANFGKYYGEAPGYGIIAVAVAIFIGSFNDNIKTQKIGGYVILFIGTLFLILVFIFSNIWFVTFGGGIAFTMLIFLVFTYKKDWREYKTIAIIIILLAIINPLLFVQTSKILCGRVRYNDLNSDYSNFTPWYLPLGSDFTKFYQDTSFPSGHTAIGWMLLPLLIVVKDRKLNDPIRILTTVLIIGWGLFVGISRIIAGDHFASDVLFSTGVAFIATIILYKKFYVNNK